MSDVTLQDFVDVIETESKKPFNQQRRVRDCIPLRMLSLRAQGKSDTKCICTADCDIAFGCVFEVDSVAPIEECSIALALRKHNSNATEHDCHHFVTPVDCNFGEPK
jgi:hypothetical protein